jgi:glycosyltransferase involved in cell wall biosynthesis
MFYNPNIILASNASNVPLDVTIIIPTYNNVSFIDKCLNSIKENINEFLKIEIIIGIDNCEKTKKHILNSNLYVDSNISVYYFEKNVGPYVVKNTLIKHATNEKIIFFDSDDYFKNNSIKNVANSLNRYDYVLFKFNNIKNEVIDLSKDSYSTGVAGVKKSTFLSLNGYYPWTCAADSEFGRRIKSRNIKCFKLNEIIFFRKIHGNNLTIAKETGFNSSIRKRYISLIKKLASNNYPSPIKLFTEENYYLLKKI